MSCSWGGSALVQKCTPGLRRANLCDLLGRVNLLIKANRGMHTLPLQAVHRSVRLRKALALAAAALLLPGMTTQAQDDDLSPAMQRALEMEARIARYEEALGALQSAHGPFDQRLLEPLDDLIGVHIENERFDDAVTLLDQQLQIQRITHGLYSPEQIPVIETLLELHSRQGQWGRIDDTLQYLGWLYERDDSLPAEARLAGLKKIGEWHLQALEKDERVREAHHLVRLSTMEEKAAELAEEHLGADSEALVPYLYDKSVAELYIALAIMLTDDTSQALMLETEGVRNRGTLGAGSGVGGLGVAEVEAIYGSRASTVIERSFKANMGASYEELERIRDIYAGSGNREAEAMALMAMGDSVLMRTQFEDRPGSFAGMQRGTSSAGAAMMSYQDAFELLSEAGFAPERIAALTRCPVMLPLTVFHASIDAASPRCEHVSEPVSYTLDDYNLISTLIPGLQGDPANPEGTLEARLRFNVRSNGQVGNVEYLEVTPDSTPNRVKLRKLTELLQFRPVMRDGVPVRAENVLLTVRMPAARK